MKRIVTILIVFTSLFAKAQTGKPSGSPSIDSRKFVEQKGYYKNDSGIINANRDTNWIPRFKGTQVYWENTGVDSATWTWDGLRWKKTSESSGTGSSPVYLDNVNQMMAYAGSPSVLFVKDTLRGGKFMLFNNPSGIYVDSGICFPASGVGANYFWVRDITNASAFNPCWYGADRDSTTDDTRAIDLMIASAGRVLLNNYSQVRGGNRVDIYFPPGLFTYSGDGWGRKMGGAFYIHGAGEANTRIKITSDIYLIDDSVNTKSFEISDIQFVGAYKGIYRNKFDNNIGGNTVNSKRFTNLTITGYTVCAISTNSGDDPFYKITNCKFNGGDDSKAIMLQGGGGSEVSDCWFVAGRYYLHMRGASGVTVRHNSFNGVRATTGKVDIWIEPKYDTTGRFPSAEGLHIYDNIHGNENDNVNDIFFLIAISDTSTNPNHSTSPDYGSYAPSYTVMAYSDYRIRNMFVDGEKLSSDAGLYNGIFVSYTENIGNCYFNKFVMDNSSRYLIQFPLITKFEDNNQAVGSNFIDASNIGYSVPIRYVSNVEGFGRLFDPQLAYRGTYNAYPVGDEYSYTYNNMLVSDTFYTAGSVVITGPSTQVDGTVGAYELAFGDTTTAAYVRLDTTGLIKGVPIWIEMDIAAASDSTLPDLGLRMGGTAISFMQRWSIKTPTASEGWRTFRMTRMWNGWDGDGVSNLKLLFVRPEIGTVFPDERKLRIGRVRVYQSKTPQLFPDGYWVLDTVTTYDKVAVFDSDTLRSMTKASFISSLGGGTGTVTSVGVSAPSGFSVSGSPVTSSGTIAISTSLNGILYGNGSNTVAAATVGSGLSFSAGTLSANISNADTTTAGLVSVGNQDLKGRKTIYNSGIGTTSTPTLILSNNGTATSTLNQWSPALEFKGSSWKTNATAAARDVNFRVENQTVTGTSNGKGNLQFSVSINGGSYSSVGGFTDIGGFYTAGASAIGTGPSTSAVLTINEATGTTAWTQGINSSITFNNTAAGTAINGQATLGTISNTSGYIGYGVQGTAQPSPSLVYTTAPLEQAGVLGKYSYRLTNAGATSFTKGVGVIAELAMGTGNQKALSGGYAFLGRISSIDANPTAKFANPAILRADSVDNNYYSGNVYGLDFVGSNYIHNLGGKARVGDATRTAPVSTFEIAGSFSLAYREATTTTSLTASDYTLNCTSGTFTATLPTAVGIQGRVYQIVNSGAGTITLATTSSQTIGNASGSPTSISVTAGLTYTVQSTGANWIIL